MAARFVCWFANTVLKLLCGLKLHYGATLNARDETSKESLAQMLGFVLCEDFHRRNDKMTNSLEPRKFNGISFEDWMKLVDARLSRKLGLTADDLPDWTWRDAYEDNFTPGVACADYIEDNFDGEI